MQATENPKDAPAIEDPFAVVPIVPENVESRTDAEGLVHLRVTPRLTGFKKKLADWLRQDYSQRLALDEVGTQFFNLIDGQRRLKDIADEMAAVSDRPRKDIESGIILFTKQLMTRHMIVLKVFETKAEIAND